MSRDGRSARRGVPAGWCVLLTERIAPRAIGWREWVGLPELGIRTVKAKVDTGARSSAPHAFNVRTVTRRGKEYVQFKVHPRQRDTDHTVSAEAAVIDHRAVKSSTGERTIRPVIETLVEFQGEEWLIELTLVGRDEMGFRMLLGRQAIRGRYLVDAGRSFLGGRPKKRIAGTGKPRRKRPN